MVGALGPRVGGAYVAVSTQLDSKSIDLLGKRIQQQLANIGRQNRSVYRELGRSAVVAWRAALGAALAAGPLIGSAASAAAGSVTALAGAFFSLGQSATAALPLLTSVGLAGITASIGLRNFGAAVSETSAKGLEDLLKDMPVQMQNAVLATRELSNELRAAVFPKLFAGLSDGIESLTNTGVVQRGLESMAESINGLVRSLLEYANSARGLSTIDKFLQNNAKVFAELSNAAAPFLDGFLNLVNALTPAAIRLSGRITDLAERFSAFTGAADYAENLDDSMKKAETTAGLLLTVFDNIGGALKNVFGAANPATNSLLETLISVTQRFEDFTSSVKGQRAIADWAMTSVDVLRQFGSTIEAVASVFAKLADARIVVSFLKTVEGAFDLLNRLPLEQAVSLFATFTEALQPISSAFLAIIASAVVFNIAIGSISGQLGGLFSVLKSFGGLGKVFAFGGLGLLAVGIFKIISRSEELKEKVGTAFGALQGVFDSLKRAFTVLSDALKPVGESLGPVVAALEKMAGVAIGAVLDVIISGLNGLAGVIDKAALAIPGLVNALKNLFSGSNGDKATGKLRSGLAALGEGFNKVKAIVLDDVLPALKQFAGYIIENAVPIFKSIADLVVNRILPTLGALAAFLVGTVIPAVVKIVGAIAQQLAPVFTQLVETFRNDVLPTLNELVDTFRTRILPALEPVIKKILIVVGALAALAAAILGRVLPPLIRLGGYIFKNLVPFIADLIVFVLKLIEGFSNFGIAVFKAGARVVEFVTNLVDNIRNGFDNVTQIIGDLPGFIVGLVPDMLRAGGRLIGGFFDGILNAAQDVGGFLGEVGDAVVGAIIGAFNNVVDFLNDAIPDKIALRFAPDINLPNDPIPKIPGFARGTNNYPGGVGLVGEEGPELVTLPRGSRIKTNAETRGILSGDDGDTGGGGNIYIGKMMPHNYGEFERQIRDQKRLAALGGRRAASA